jgi:hypothetical protein
MLRSPMWCSGGHQRSKPSTNVVKHVAAGAATTTLRTTGAVTVSGIRFSFPQLGGELPYRPRPRRQQIHDGASRAVAQGVEPIVMATNVRLPSVSSH